jgi:hypothetical protein
MKTFCARIVLLLCCAALLASCSQHRYFSTSNRIGEAREALAKAKAAGAEAKAPMDYYMAQEYIDYGVKESMEGDNKQAQIYAGKSLEHSEQAIRTAGGGAK